MVGYASLLLITMFIIVIVIEKGFLVESAPMLEYGERSDVKYYEFSRKGKELFDWYVYDTWFYIKYKIFHWHYLKYKIFYKLFRYKH